MEMKVVALCHDTTTSKHSLLVMSILMKALRALGAACLCIAGCASSSGVRRADLPHRYVDYHVAVDTNSFARFLVEARLHGIARDSLVFNFPVWGPGAYDIVDYGKYVDELSAYDELGRPLVVRRIGDNSFLLRNVGSNAVIRYGVRTIGKADNSAWFCISDMGKDYAFANAVALYGYPDGYKDVPYFTSYSVPAGWAISTALDSADNSLGYVAGDYDELVDAPVQMGKFRRVDFVVKGKPHTVVLRAFGIDDGTDIDDMADSIARVVDVASSFFGEMPYKRYVFQVNVADVRSRMSGGLSGALEHRNSSTYLIGSTGEDITMGLKGIVMHEYWHLWSPKRIHADALGPFDYQHEPRTSSLWFAEGLTEYCSQIMMTRSGLRQPEAYIDDLERAVQPFWNGRQRRSITDLSRNISSVGRDEMMVLYSKGPLLGLLLDIEIRTQSKGLSSLDDVMLYFNEHFGKTGAVFGDEDIVPIMERAAGVDISSFYERYINGTDSLPVCQYLSRIGLRCQTITFSRRDMDAEIRRVREGGVVTNILPGGSADAMGLHQGDTIRAIVMDDRRFSYSSLPSHIEEVLPNLMDVALKFVVVREGGEAVIAATFKERAAERPAISIDPGAPLEARNLRRSMLGF